MSTTAKPLKVNILSNIVIRKPIQAPTADSVQKQFNVSSVIDKVGPILSNANCSDYARLVSVVSDCIENDDDVLLLLRQLSDCIRLLNKDLRLLVEAVLAIKWYRCRQDVIGEYQLFLIDLLVAHSGHTKFAIGELVNSFVPDPSDPEWPDGNPGEADRIACLNVHYVISRLLELVPICREILLEALIRRFPYFKQSTHMHQFYVHNLLWTLEYRPDLRGDILELIFSKLIILDVNAPKEKILSNPNLVFRMDEDESETKHSIAHTLDVCLDMVFNYCLIECHDKGTCQLNWEETKTLYQDLIKIFDKILLPTYNTHHVQFVMFLMCSFKLTIAEAFINYLWKKVCTPGFPPIHRQAAVAYIASLLARGSFISINILKVTLQEMAKWIHMYIDTQDGLDSINWDLRIHSVFYSVCQAVFYIITFRHKDFVSKRGLLFLESLGLAKMVACRLNPLRVCYPAVVQNFASVMRSHQLVYCYTVIENNSRNCMPTIYQDDRGTTIISNNVLDSFFPFDPYILKKSRRRIIPSYLNYDIRSIDELMSPENEKEQVFDMDDFLSYGSSPGFKFKT